ncbi:tetratricopeptide repeat protein [Actinoplanes friuliensis]|uniref:tetratricopeptide repeat protein n=1 Tax=Actinoplanes friuliensis TaxID=196914 RepID=UPI00042838F9|nr:tetratricopeptide repeat protein [Actinoplanes friuliensis]
MRTEVADAAVWFDTEHPALLAAIDLAAQQGFDTHVWQLSWLVRDYLNRHGLWHHLQTSQLAALAAAQRSGTPPVVARVLWGVALAEANLGRYEAAHAHLLRSLAIFTAAGDQLSIAFTRRRIVYVLTQQDDFGAALELAEAELAQSLPGTGPEQRAHALNTVSWLCSQLGRFDEAVAHAREAVALVPLLRPFTAADLWDTLGSAQAGQGFVDAAEDSYRRAAQIYHQQGATFLEAQVWRALGDARQDAGRDAEAGHAYRLAFDLVAATRDPRAVRLGTDLQRLLHRQPAQDVSDGMRPGSP